MSGRGDGRGRGRGRGGGRPRSSARGTGGTGAGSGDTASTGPAASQSEATFELVLPTDSEIEEMFYEDYESKNDDSDLEELIGNNVREEEDNNKYNDNAADDNLEFYLQDIRNERRFRNICFHCPSLRLKVPVRNVSPVWRVSWDQGTPREG